MLGQFGQLCGSQRRPAGLAVFADHLLELLAGLAQLRQRFEAAPRLVQGGCAPLRLGVQNVDLQQLANGIVVVLLGEQALTNLKLGPRAVRSGAL